MVGVCVRVGVDGGELGGGDEAPELRGFSELFAGVFKKAFSVGDDPLVSHSRRGIGCVDSVKVCDWRSRTLKDMLAKDVGFFCRSF